MSPMTPESDTIPSFACVVRMPSTSSPIDRSISPCDLEPAPEVSPKEAPRRDRFDTLTS